MNIKLWSILSCAALALAAGAAPAAEAPGFMVAGLRVMPDRWDKEANFRPRWRNLWATGVPE